MEGNLRIYLCHNIVMNQFNSNLVTEAQKGLKRKEEELCFGCVEEAMSKAVTTDSLKAN